jgi:hypothetical protein
MHELLCKIPYTYWFLRCEPGSRKNRTQAKVQGVQTRATLVDKSVERLTASPVMDQEGFQGVAMVSSKEEHPVGDRAASTELQLE